MAVCLRRGVKIGHADPGVRWGITFHELINFDGRPSLTHLFDGLLKIGEPLGR